MPVGPTYPGVHSEEIPEGDRSIRGVSTSDTAFVDFFARGPMDRAAHVASWTEFERTFGGLDRRSAASYAIRQFYSNGGRIAWVCRVSSPSAAAEPGTKEWITSAGRAALLGESTGSGFEPLNRGLYMLDRIAFNLLCVPAAADLDENGYSSVVTAATRYCRDKRAFFLVDIPSGVKTTKAMRDHLAGIPALRDDHVAVYFPRVTTPDPLDGHRPRNVGASGTLAGLYARTDTRRGVWKAPAGTEAILLEAEPATRLTDAENDALNRDGINALRSIPSVGNVVWGSRTMDAEGAEWKYIPIRRTALYIQESLFQGLKWVNFEPNNEVLWAKIRSTVGAFMNNLFRQGAFQGGMSSEAYFVRCDAETTSQHDIHLGLVNFVVGFAPLKPAEFVIIKIQQMTGQSV